MTNESSSSPREGLIERIHAAHAELCAAVHRQWGGGHALKMSIPARLDHDTDIIIGSALREAAQALQSTAQERDEAIRQQNANAAAAVIVAEERNELRAAIWGPSEAPSGLLHLGYVSLAVSFRERAEAAEAQLASTSQRDQAIREYVEHKSHCALVRWKDSGPVCTCGLSTLLGDQP